MFSSALQAWWPFELCFGLMLFFALIMFAQAKHFYTMNDKLRLFSIMELELPSSPSAVAELIKGIYMLPKKKRTKVLFALRGQLIVDFFFMPVTYGSIFFLCMKLYDKMHTAGHIFFFVLACLQVIPWVLDILENIFLLTQIKKNVSNLGRKSYRTYLCMEALKWGIAVISSVCALSTVTFFWLSGNFSISSYNALLIVAAEIAGFAALSFLGKRWVQQPVRIER